MKLHKVDFVCSGTQPAHFPTPDRPEVAFAGRSNVGKSSLLNSLMERRNLARTSKTPGRTRLINFFDINGELFLVDLPGYGYARVSKAEQKSWGQMLERYIQGRPNLCAVVSLIDIRHKATPHDITLLDGLHSLEMPTIIALTKADKLSKSQRFRQRNALGKQLGLDPKHLIPTSATTGLGRDALWELIEQVTTPPEDTP